MSTIKIFRALLYALIASLFHSPAFAQTIVNWTNGSGDQLWQTAENWDSGTVPTNDSAVVINNGGHVVIDGVAADMWRVYVADGPDETGTLELVSGTISAQGGPFHHPMRVGMNKGTGHYIQHDGFADFGGNRFQVGLGIGATGTVDIHGGTFIAARGYNNHALHIGDKGTGTFNVHGGIVRTRNGVLLGFAGGVGTFAIHGSNATEIGIGQHRSASGRWTHASESILKILLDDNGVTPIHIDNSGGSASDMGSISFADGAHLEVGFLNEEVFGEWVIMTWDDGVAVTDNGLSFVQGTALHQWSYIIDEANRELRIVRADNPSPPNEPPTTRDITFPVGSGKSVELDVLKYASDTDWDPISIKSIATSPQHGTAVIENGSIVYTAEDGYTRGQDTFTYTITDGEASTTASITMVVRKFNHPGLWHTQADLDRMIAMIAAEKDPWYTSFLNMAEDPLAQWDYEIQKDPDSTYLNRENPCVGCRGYENDARAAYLNALMWNFTGDARHAIKSIEILNAWTNLTHVDGIPLGAGLYAAMLVNAAELMRYTSDLWTDEEIKAFEDSLVYPGYSNMEAPTTSEVTWYWKTYMGDPRRAGNQDALCWRSVMNMGVFLDNEIMYERGLRYFLGLPHREDDLPYQSGPPINSSTPYIDTEFRSVYQSLGFEDEIEDYGYDGQIQHYIYENGQCQESARDQGHAMLGIGALVEASEIAWNQGYDMYSHLDHRILLGLEYTLRYNVSYDHAFPDQMEPWEPVEGTDDFIQGWSRTGRVFSKKINPYLWDETERITRGTYEEYMQWELPTAHYEIRLGMPQERYKWTKRARDKSIETNGYERHRMPRNGLSNPMWGGLTARRAVNMAGNPITGFQDGLPVFSMPKMGGSIRAANYDHFTADGNGRTYYDTTEGNSGGVYREEDVDLVDIPTEGVVVTDMDDGEWLTYTVNVERIGNYAIKLRYASASANASIKFNFNGEDKTNEIPLPATGGASDFAEKTVMTDLPLDRGAQAMRVVVSGESSGLSISEITIRQQFGPPAIVETVPTFGGRILITWDENESADAYNLYRAESAGGPYTLVAEGLESTQFFDEMLEENVPYHYIVRSVDGTNLSNPSPESIAVSWTASSVDYEQVVLADEPSLYYTFSETTGNRAASIAQSMTFGLINEPGLDIDGVVGSSIELDGARAMYGTARNRPAAGISEDLSVSLWMKLGEAMSADPYQSIISKGDSAYELAVNSDTKTLRFSLRGGSGGDVDLHSDTNLPVGTWVHVAAVFDFSDREMRLYINGQKDPNTATRVGTIGENGSHLTVGSQGQSQFFTGLLDDIAIYPTALSQESIASQFSTGQFIGIPSAVEYWCSYPLSPDHNYWVDTGSFLSWINVAEAPWLWSSSLDGWIMTANCPQGAGAWVYLSR